MTYDTPCMQVFGRVDQSAGMLDDDAKEKGYTLLCVSEPQEDCKIATIEEVSSIRAASLYSNCVQGCLAPCHNLPLPVVEQSRLMITWLLQDEILEQVLCSSG